LALAVALLACGCAAPRTDAPSRQYDLGASPPAASLPPLRAVSVRAAMPYDGTAMHYRLAWGESSELAAFAASRWAAPPAELFRRQLARALPANSGASCALEVELHEFVQVFRTPQTSEVRIELRAAAGGAARGFRVSEGDAGRDAASGARAFARAAERTIAEIGSWIATLATCR
jgi:cholesterol transport system auxiliary component